MRGNLVEEIVVISMERRHEVEVPFRVSVQTWKGKFMLMMSCIRLYSRTIALLVLGFTWLQATPSALALTPWVLDSSSLSQSATAFAEGNADDMNAFWDEFGTVDASYMVTDSGLSVSVGGEAFASVDFVPAAGEEYPGGLGLAAAASFEGEAHATWTPRSGGGGPAATVTTSGEVTGSTGITNNSYIDDTCEFILVGGDAAGKSRAYASSDGSDSIFLDTPSVAELTNYFQGLTDNGYTANDSTYATTTVTTDIYNCTPYPNGYAIYSVVASSYSISWTSDYDTASGLTSIYGDCSAEGTVTANYTIDDYSTDDGQDQLLVQSGVTMSGTVGVSISNVND